MAAAEGYAGATRPLLAAKALEAAAGQFAEAGEHGQARAAAARALAGYTRLGASADASRIRARFGGPPFR